MQTADKTYLSAGDAHGHTHRGLAQGRGVVYTVAGHGHDVAVLLQK
jgi:hypothetical protein